MNFSFGSTTPKTTSGITLGNTATPSTTTAATGFNLGQTPQSSAVTGISFGSIQPSVPGFSLGGAGDSKTSAQTAAIKPIAAAAPISSTASSSFSLGTATTTSATVAFPSFGLTPTTAISSTTPQTSAPSFSFGPSALTTTSTAISYSLTPSTTTLKLDSTPVSSLGQTATSATTVTTATTTASTTPATLNNITFVQLEETINKWSHELEEQEKIFMSQAAQINNWDNLLNANSEKIVALNNEVADMKVQQQQLDHELNFILAQQRELEEVLIPLEKQTADAPTSSDPEREHTYHMADSLDTQLKQMSDDLRDIIEHLNESSRTQDNSDPIVQIGRILNAHMNSLHWIDQMTLNIQNQLENVTKLHDIHRRENERSFRISYE